ncbi:LURP-one-related/scramblase family protein [Clostridium polynesiense]|uniref:LURP-one-related/scramblase family protein n=1 Tax=Clostridium polynesiense TaxID=1325933 RepID=UPI00058F8E92|nr:LURP-one-related family protein [Clostridium polynesiense]
MRFYIKEKLFSLGDSFVIWNQQDEEAFYVKGQVFSFGNKLRLYDKYNNELIYIEQKVFSLMPEYNIYAGNNLLANIRKKVRLFSHSFNIESLYGSFNIEGDYTAHDFSVIKNSSKNAASLSKKWFSFGDTYEIYIADDENIPFMLALVIVIDQAIHDKNNN